MPMLEADRSALLMIDFQLRLMPAIEGGADVIDHARRLVAGAELLGVPTLFTEQNPDRLGPTVPELAPAAGRAFGKMAFGCAGEPGFLDRLPEDRAIVVAGCEAHVCVLQTVLGLLDHGRSVYVVRDAIGSRRAESKETALLRMASHGAEIVTAEMALFEWLGTAGHPRFREVSALIR